MLTAATAAEITDTCSFQLFPSPRPRLCVVELFFSFIMVSFVGFNGLNHNTNKNAFDFAHFPQLVAENLSLIHI